MLDAVDLRLISLTREGFPMNRDPYGSLGQTLRISAEEVLNRLQRMVETGVIRRVSAIVDQRRAGFAGNVMVAWVVGEEQADAVGAELAVRSEVTHCYLRKVLPGWPYNLYAMVHGENVGACRRLIAELTESLGLPDPAVLPTVRELKRAPLPSPSSAE